MTGPTWRIVHGDCLDVLDGLAPDSVDAVVTDPPYDLTSVSRGGSPRVNDPSTPFGRTRLGGDRGGFMGKTWDGTGVAFRVQTWAEVIRVIKPGGHLIAFGGTRTHHRLWCALEDAGFEIRDTLCWLYGSGFPKSMDISKAIDKDAGIWRGRAGPVTISEQPSKGTEYERRPKGDPATAAAAAAWQGFGTALKPAFEPIVLARKPISESTVAANVQRWRTGALNIDRCRIEHDGRGTWGDHGGNPEHNRVEPGSSGITMRPGWNLSGSHRHSLGRWPANLVLSHTPECQQIGTRRVQGSRIEKASEHEFNAFADGGLGGPRPARGIGDADGLETVEEWRCHPECPVALLDAQSGERPSSTGIRPLGTDNVVYGKHRNTPFESYGDTGGASRFFYCSKADRAERDVGLEHFPALTARETVNQEIGSPGTRSPRAGSGRSAGMPGMPIVRNVHPTVKPVALMQWLCRLVTPTGGLVLDPFAGSGSTGIAAMREGLSFLGIDQDAEYCALARERIIGDAPLFNAAAESAIMADPATGADR